MDSRQPMSATSQPSPCNSSIPGQTPKYRTKERQRKGNKEADTLTHRYLPLDLTTLVADLPADPIAHLHPFGP